METVIKSGSPQAVKLYATALFAQVQKVNSKLRTMTGPKPTSGEVSKKLSKQQSDPGQAIVEIFDLAHTAGESVTMDCINVSAAEPIMGDRNAEGLGTPLSFSTFELKLNQWTFPVAAGGAMSQQRTPHDLRKLARDQAVGLVSRYWEQRNMVHLAGARGVVNTRDWTIPLDTAGNFAEIMVNAVKAPTYNRHFVVSGNNIVQGGAALATIASTDTLKLTHIDQLRNVIDNLDLSLQPIVYKDDMAASDSPMWVMFTPANVYSNLLTEGSLRAFQANAQERAKYFQNSKHPLFAGECGMWNGILVVKITRAVIRFLASTQTNIVTAGNAGTATESAVTITAGLTAGYAVERCILLGAQALAIGYGKDSESGYHYSWGEKLHNFKRSPEFAVFGIEASAKVRFDAPDEFGVKTPTDHGVIVLDCATKLSVL